MAAESRGATSVRIFRLEAGKPDKLVGKPLTELDFLSSDADARTKFRDLVAAAEALRTAAMKPAPGQPKPTFAQLKAKQADLKHKITVLIQEMTTDHSCIALGAGCFGAGTKLWTELGYRNIEDIQPGERVYSRDQWDAGGEIAAKIVEEVFTRYAGIWEIVAGGQTIRTTMEHPFFVVGKGWTVAHELRANDKLLCADGTTVSVDSITDTGNWEVVYNLRVSEWHTYFVGDESWGVVWAHNAYLKTVERVQFASSTSIIAVSIQHRQDMDVTPGRNVAVAKVILPNGSVEYWSSQSGGDRVRRYAVVSGQVALVGQITGIGPELAQMTSLASGAEYSNLHSEEVLLAGLNHYGRTPNHSLRLTDFYTEYAPCGCLQGSHQCSSRLHRWSLATNPNAWRRPDTVRVDTSVVKYSQFYPDSSAGRTTHRRFHMAISRAVAGENLTRADILGEHYFQHQQISGLPLQHAIRQIRSIGSGIDFPLPP